MELKLRLAAAALAAGFMASAAQAAPIYLDFEGIAPYPNSNNVSINGFYNGGTASNGTSGPNLGVEFTSQALLLCLNTAGTSCSNTSRGGLGIPTSAQGALFFLEPNPVMNVAAGFDTGFAFVYSSPFLNASVNIFDGLDGTGTLLASASLPLTVDGSGLPDCEGSNYCPFNPFSIAFSGVARSVVFTGQTNSQVFDDFTFGSISVGGTVPEPATWAMMIGGMGLAGGSLRARRRKVAFAAA